LSNREQSVKINSTLSDKIPVTSGVPQGSILGPTLFLLFINDLVNVIEHSEILLFADDLKIFNSSSNNFLLQSDLNNVVTWSKIWQLPISVKKCNILYIGRNNPNHKYYLDGVQLESVGSSCKDLGVFISSDLSSRVHCANIVAKASRISNMIHRCFISKNVGLKVKAFKAYVLPILEYSSVVWNPHFIIDIQNVEKVQRRFTKRILFRGGITYSERLSKLNLERLELRRLYNDIIFAYRIIKLKILDHNNFYCTPPPSVTRASQLQRFYIPKFRTDCMRYSFSVRSANYGISCQKMLKIQLQLYV
jgi:hypothetical protein